MKLKAFILLITLFFSLFTLSAKQGMDFQLYNLGSDGTDDFLSLSKQFSQVISPMFFGEAETRGIKGFEFGVGYTLTTINTHESYWKDGFNDKPLSYGTPPFYNGVDLHIRKGFSYGLKLFGNVRYFILTEMMSAGIGAEYAISEGMIKIPDISLGGGYTRLFSGGDMNMQMGEIRLKLSKTFVMAKEVKLTPILAYSHLFVVASSKRLGGYSNSFPETNAPAYDADKAGTPFYFDDEFINIDRLVLGLSFSRGYLGMNLETILPFNTLKAFSFIYGLSFRM
ncbi:MAG: hypothetical protein R6W70_05530 [bacterium]